MQLRPYGDTANDGMVQLSFTLPLPLNAQSQEAARQLFLEAGRLDKALALHEREEGLLTSPAERASTRPISRTTPASGRTAI